MKSHPIVNLKQEKDFTDTAMIKLRLNFVPTGFGYSLRYR